MFSHHEVCDRQNDVEELLSEEACMRLVYVECGCHRVDLLLCCGEFSAWPLRVGIEAEALVTLNYNNVSHRYSEHPIIRN